MRATLAVVAVLAVALAAVPLPVAAHVNHVSADAQASPDGTLVAETAFIADDGYLVVHRSDGGDIGEPVGHVPLSQAGGLETDVSVTVDPEVWADWSTGEVWLVLHNSDGDGGFEPGEDPILETFGQPAGERITVSKGDRALVTTEGFAPQRLNASHTSVTVRNATLPTDGAVVVRNGTDGQVLGRTDLAAGNHANVSVALNESFLRATERFGATAVLVDGSGEPLSIGEQRVATSFGVRYQSDGTQATPTPALVTTATATPTGGSSASGSTTADQSTPDTATDAGGPGFGLVAAVVALALAALVGRNRI